MATVLEKKNGGPYTKGDQEKRRVKVYSLYFEKGYSALKIADTLDVNRNTVNEDIKYWSRQIAAEFGKENLAETLCRQIERLDIQRRRILDEIEKQDDIAKKIQLEKLLFGIDYKITGVISKALGANLQVENLGNEETSEEEITGIIRKICLSGNIRYPESLDEKGILKQVILIKGCNERHARDFFKDLKKMGLGLCQRDGSSWNKFDMLEFAVIRKIITSKEKEEFYEKREERDRKEEQRQDEIEKRFETKYGSDRSKWPQKVEKQMEDEIFGTT